VPSLIALQILEGGRLKATLFSREKKAAIVASPWQKVTRAVPLETPVQ
jgi:hypothetical protein